MTYLFKKRTIGFTEYVRLFFIAYVLLCAAYTVAAFVIGGALGMNTILPLYQPVFASAFIGVLFATVEGELPLWEESWRLCRRFALVSYPISVSGALIYVSNASISGFIDFFKPYADRGVLFAVASAFFVLSLGMALFQLLVMRHVLPVSAKLTLFCTRSLGRGA